MGTRKEWGSALIALGAGIMLISACAFGVLLERNQHLFGGEVQNESASDDHAGVHASGYDWPDVCGYIEVVVTATPTPTDVPACEAGTPTPTGTINTPVVGPTSTPELTPTVVATGTQLGPTATREPTRPLPTPTVVEPTSTVEPTDVPQPTRASCNRGLGNGSEDCDPGNSGGKPGSAGEGNE